jgi:hypothetical protein
MSQFGKFAAAMAALVMGSAHSFSRRVDDIGQREKCSKRQTRKATIFVPPVRDHAAAMSAAEQKRARRVERNKRLEERQK